MSTLLNRLLTAAVVAVAAVSMVGVSSDAEAKRLGSGRPAGMQRQMPAKQAPATPPSQQAAPQQANQPNVAPAQAAGGMAQAAAPKRSWMGPIAGLAAGLGLAALASHFGFGEALANGMMMALLAVVAVVAIGWLMRRLRGGNAAPMGGPQYAGAGAGLGGAAPVNLQRDIPAPQPVAANNMAREAQNVFGGAAVPAQGAALASAAPADAHAMQLPPGFDAEGFTRVAKMIFIRLQAANDEANVDDLRRFTTPELFASLRLDLQERGNAAQKTDVPKLDAELVDAAQADGQWVVSVRFSGLIQEDAAHGAQPFEELWHLVKPVQGEGDWAIAGITPIGQ